MRPELIRNVLLRDLRAVAREVEAYPDDELLWRAVPGLPNSGGTLALHLAGNLQHYIGAVLGRTGYVRDRDAEFSSRDLPRATVRAAIDAAVEAVDVSLAALTAEQLEAPYPERVVGRTVGTADFLVHLVAHLGYHLGQLDYHRRMVSPEAEAIGAISLRDLPEHDASGSRT